jgi:sec-independent protein translocase protein TatC
MSTATQSPPADAVEVRMTFGEHLEELRWVLVKSLVALIATFIVSAVFYKEYVYFIVQPHFQVMEWLKVPEAGRQFIAGAYTKPIWAVLKLSFIIAFFASSPFIAYQIWKFVSAGLYPRERRYVTRYAPASFLLFIGGCVFGYLVLIPYGLYGMAEMFNMDEIVKPTYMITDYLDLVMALTIVTGVVFQLPLIMAFCSAIGLANAKTWIRWIRFAIVAIFVASAILTPTPDVFTQLLLAIPLLILYGIGIGLAALVAKPAPKPA